MSEVIIATSTIFRESKIHLPKQVREFLKVGNGDRVVWVVRNNELILRSAKRERDIFRIR